jgi:hypothetical protein
LQFQRALLHQRQRFVQRYLAAADQMLMFWPARPTAAPGQGRSASAPGRAGKTAIVRSCPRIAPSYKN